MDPSCNHRNHHHHHQSCTQPGTGALVDCGGLPACRHPLSQPSSSSALITPSSHVPSLSSCNHVNSHDHSNRTDFHPAAAAAAAGSRNGIWSQQVQNHGTASSPLNNNNNSSGNGMNRVMNQPVGENNGSGCASCCQTPAPDQSSSSNLIQILIQNQQMILQQQQLILMALMQQQQQSVGQQQPVLQFQRQPQQNDSHNQSCALSSGFSHNYCSHAVGTGASAHRSSLVLAAASGHNNPAAGYHQQRFSGSNQPSQSSSVKRARGSDVLSAPMHDQRLNNQLSSSSTPRSAFDRHMVTLTNNCFADSNSREGANHSSSSNGLISGNGIHGPDFTEERFNRCLDQMNGLNLSSNPSSAMHYQYPSFPLTNFNNDFPTFFSSAAAPATASGAHPLDPNHRNQDEEEDELRRIVRQPYTRFLNEQRRSAAVHHGSHQESRQRGSGSSRQPEERGASGSGASGGEIRQLKNIMDKLLNQQQHSTTNTAVKNAIPAACCSKANNLLQISSSTAGNRRNLMTETENGAFSPASVASGSSCSNAGSSSSSSSLTAIRSNGSSTLSPSDSLRELGARLRMEAETMQNQPQPPHLNPGNNSPANATASHEEEEGDRECGDNKDTSTVHENGLASGGTESDDGGILSEGHDKVKPDDSDLRANGAENGVDGDEENGEEDDEEEEEDTLIRLCADVSEADCEGQGL